MADAAANRACARHADDALDRLFFRSAGAPLVGGNAVQILLDGDQNYPRWLQAIDAARRTIHLEMYIVHNDVIGRRFRDALVARARAGVTVRVLYDWFGALRPSSFRFWAPLVRRRWRGACRQRAAVPHAVQCRQPRSSQAADG